MIAVTYNIEEPNDKSPGFVLFTTGSVTLAKHEEGGYSLCFMDEEGGCLVSIEVNDNVLHNLVALRDDEHAKAFVVLEPEPGPPMPEGWEPPF